MDKIHYKGWEIIPTALPTSDQKWSASIISHTIRVRNRAMRPWYHTPPRMLSAAGGPLSHP